MTDDPQDGENSTTGWNGQTLWTQTGDNLTAVRTGGTGLWQLRTTYRHVKQLDVSLTTIQASAIDESENNSAPCMTRSAERREPQHATACKRATYYSSAFTASNNSVVHYLSNKHVQTSLHQIDLKGQLVLWKQSSVPSSSQSPTYMLNFSRLFAIYKCSMPSGNGRKPLLTFEYK